MKCPDASSATNNQFFVDNNNNVVNSIPRQYANPVIYPLNRTNLVDKNVAASQLRAANSMLHQQGNARYANQQAIHFLLLSVNFANLQHPQQYAAAVLPSGMALAPVATRQFTTPLGNLQPTKMPRPVLAR